MKNKYMAHFIVLGLVFTFSTSAETPPGLTAKPGLTEETAPPAMTGDEPGQKTGKIVFASEENSGEGNNDNATLEKRPGDADTAVPDEKNQTLSRGKTIRAKTDEQSGEISPGNNAPDRSPDRRWILKMGDEKGKHPRAEPEPISWDNNTQQTSCESYLPGLKESFRQARYYSVHGDACNTARYSDEFLSLVKDCRKMCPENFLETTGYTDYIIRNVGLLYELGHKRCLEPVKEAVGGERR